MLRKRVFPVAAAVAAAVAFGGCAPAVKEAYFRSVELTPASQSGVEIVADLQVVGTKKVIGTARGPAGTPDREDELRVQALEAALASDTSGPDVLVAPGYYELRIGGDSMSVTVVGYPARYRNFRRSATASAKGKLPFSTKQLPGGATVVSYDKNAFTAKLVNDNMIAVQAVQSNNRAAPAVGAAEEAGASTEKPTAEQTGE